MCVCVCVCVANVASVDHVGIVLAPRPGTGLALECPHTHIVSLPRVAIALSVDLLEEVQDLPEEDSAAAEEASEGDGGLAEGALRDMQEP